jgi:hypothetical protein
MSGISHILLLGFTISFILEGISDAQTTDDDGQAVNGYIVLCFAVRFLCALIRFYIREK